MLQCGIVFAAKVFFPYIQPIFPNTGLWPLALPLFTSEKMLFLLYHVLQQETAAFFLISLVPSSLGCTIKFLLGWPVLQPLSSLSVPQLGCLRFVNVLLAM